MINREFVTEVGSSKWALRTCIRQFTKRILGRDLTMTLPTGGRIILPKESKSATEVFVTRANIDWGSETLLAMLADTSSDFLDVGAHIGYYSAYMSPITRNVIAFEPDPRNLPKLHANARLYRNITIVEEAIATDVELQRFQIGSGTSTGHLDNKHSEGTIEIRTTTLDNFFAARPDLNITLIKTEIEGFDFDALVGGQELIKSKRPIILTEATYDERLVAFCKGIDYVIGGYTRTPSGECRYRIIESEARVKMLFLIPSEKSAKVAAVAASL